MLEDIVEAAWETMTVPIKILEMFFKQVLWLGKLYGIMGRKSGGVNYEV